MILPVMCVLLLGTFDLGYRCYVASIVQGALHEAARMATVGGVSTSQIEAHVHDRLHEFSRNATITTSTAHPIRISPASTCPRRSPSDTAPLGTYNAGDCYEDANGNGSTTSTAARAAWAAPRTSSISR